MKPFVKVLIWVIALSVLAIFSWLTGIWFDWPIWGGLGTFFGIIALYFAAIYCRRYWLASRSRAALARSEKNSVLKSGSSIAPLSDLVIKFKDAVTTLKKSSLKRFGNPMYVLPWYMVIGESGSGKSTAITHSSLKSAIRPHDPNDPIIQTLNCEWWFFNDAVIIDTAGRYVSPDGFDEDRVEWEKLLNLLVKYRPKEGINGLVLVIDVDRLLNKGSALLETEGQVLRSRIDQLIRLFDRRFPVYVLVTKCDKIFGFDEWVNALKEQQMQEAMGYLGELESLNNSEKSFLDKAFAKIQDRLKDLRLEIALKGAELSPSLLLLPSELERLRPGLKSFLSACMGDSNYLEQPLLRGIFLSSGTQNGEVLPSQLGDLIHGKKNRPETNKGYFLRDFFGIVLPFDRYHYLPTKLINQWRRIHRNIGLVAWALLNITVLIFISASYITTENSIKAISASYSTKYNQMPQDIFQEIDKLNALILLDNEIVAEERDWKKQWLFFTPSIKLLHSDIKKVFLNNIYHIKGPYSASANKFLLSVTDSSAPIYANALLGVIRRANQIEARMSGAGYQQLISLPQTPPDLIAYLYPGLPQKYWQAFNRIIAAYTAWSTPEELGLKKQLEDMRAKLNEEALETARMEWLLSWADSLPQLDPITLQQFWAPERTEIQNDLNSILIRRSLTKLGQKEVMQYLDEMGKALGNPQAYIKHRQDFTAWYIEERINAWLNFVASFSKGEAYLNSEFLRREMLTRINTFNSPGRMALVKMGNELDDIPKNLSPDWIDLLKEYEAYRSAALNDGNLSKVGTFLSAFDISSKKIANNMKGTKSNMSSTDMQKSIDSINALKTYYNNVRLASAKILDNENNALLMASTLFSPDGPENQQYSQLKNAFDAHKKYREASSFKSAEAQILFHLTRVSLRYLIGYSLMQASCSIQNDWEKNVLWPSQLALTPADLNNQLFGTKGSVWSFMDGNIKPFIKQSSVSIKANEFKAFTNYVLPFTPEFLPFLNNSISARVNQLIKSQKAEALKGKTAQLTISPKPTGVNPGAKAKPYSTVLSLQCAKGEISVNNLNVKTSQNLAWSPEECGDASIQISLDNLVLVKSYPGPLGLARLLEDFQDGEKVFTPLDFAANKTQLANLGVKTIQVAYNFSGKDSVLDMAEGYVRLFQPSQDSFQPKKLLKSFDVPEQIGQCWSKNYITSTPESFSEIIQQRVDANSNTKN